MKVSLIETPAQIPLGLTLAGRMADASARRRIFLDYQQRQTSNTQRQQLTTLTAFRAWLSTTAADPGDLNQDPEAWTAITWGLVAGFIRDQLSAGYAVSTVNSRLATIKRYSTLALQAGALDHQEYVVIKTLQGYSHREGRNLDRQRTAAGLSTRRGHKAASPMVLTLEQITALKAQPHKAQPDDSPLGCRDFLLICLLVDHGLRCGEVAGLTADAIDLDTGMMTFYRPKVDLVQTHKLTADTLAAAERYLTGLGYPAAGPLLRKSQKGELLQGGLSERGINKRIGELGVLVGIERLSPHSLRHTWATLAARAGTDLLALQEAGGWKGLTMPRRYIEAARIANAGVRLR